MQTSTHTHTLAFSKTNCDRYVRLTQTPFLRPLILIWLSSCPSRSLHHSSPSPMHTRTHTRTHTHTHTTTSVNNFSFLAVVCCLTFHKSAHRVQVTNGWGDEACPKAFCFDARNCESSLWRHLSEVLRKGVAVILLDLSAPGKSSCAADGVKTAKLRTNDLLTKMDDPPQFAYVSEVQAAISGKKWESQQILN